MQLTLPTVSLKAPFIKGRTPPKPEDEAFDLGVSQEVDGRVPRTQALIDVVGAHDNCLVLRDATVVGGIGFSSMDDTLLTDEDITFKLELYYDLLVTLRFPVQFLITTRPQDMSPYFTELLEQRDRHDVMRHMVEVFARKLPDYVRRTRLHGEDGFVQYFSWHPNDLIGMPGEARKVAWGLCDISKLTILRGKANDPLEVALDELCSAIRTTCGWLGRWRRILSEQIETVNGALRKAQSPVRRYYLITSHNQRLTSTMLPDKIIGKAISDREFSKASQRIAEYSRQMAAGISEMGLSAWRATHDDLLLDVRTFFNPNQSLLAGRQQRLMEQGEPVDQED